MFTRKPNGLFTRDSMVGLLMIGVALAYLILGKHPDYQLLLGSIIISFFFLIAPWLGWKRRIWLRILAYAVLLLVIITALIQEDQPEEVVEDISVIFDVQVEEKPQ